MNKPQRGVEKIIKYLYNKNKKVIIFIGKNGTGKTTTLFQVGYFLKEIDENNTLFVNLDYFKISQSYFNQKIKEYNSDNNDDQNIYSNLHEIKVKKNIKTIIKNSILELIKNKNIKYLFFDTSGRDVLNNKLLEEIKHYIEYIKQKVYKYSINHINCLCFLSWKVGIINNDLYKYQEICDGIILTFFLNINYNNLLHLVKQQKKPILFVSHDSNKESMSLFCYDILFNTITNLNNKNE